MASPRRCLAAIAVLAALLFPATASAQDVLGSIIEPIQRLWSGEAKNPVAYEVTLSVTENEGDLKDKLEEASALITESAHGAPSTPALLALARAEPARLTAALYQQGYYSGRISITVADERIDAPATQIELPEEGTIPIAVTVQPGPLFHFGRIRIADTGGKTPDGDTADIAEAVGLRSGAPAKSRAVLAAGNRLVAFWKDRGHAFAQVSSRDVIADHASRTLDVAFTVDPGRPTQFGAVEITGAERFDTDLLRSRAGIHEGEGYSPETLSAARKRLAKLDGLRGVRIIEGEKPDAHGRIPLLIEVTERKPNFVGANAAVSSVDGAEIGAYWGHRNVLGGGEALRIEGTISNLGGDAVEDLEYQVKISLTRPSIANAYTDYRTTVAFKHEVPDSYESDEATLSIGLAHQFSPMLTGELAAKSSWIQTQDDLFGESEYVLLSLPGELVYDSRDNPLDAASGWRGALFAEPAVDLYNSGAFVKTKAQLSAYAQIGEEPRIVAAARLGAGTIVGADVEDVPATARFLAGGGGSVRGYVYRSVSPQIGGERIGGLSVAEISAELRISITETIGIVPFVDAAFVTRDSFFGGGGELALGAGLGLRYYTPIGPIRFDLATPLNRLDDEPEIVFYVGLGQAF